MSTNRKRRGFLGGVIATSLAGLIGWVTLKGRPPVARRDEERARSMLARLDLPDDVRALMRSFSQDPTRVRKFQELTRWRSSR